MAGFDGAIVTSGVAGTGAAAVRLFVTGGGIDTLPADGLRQASDV